MRTAHRNASRAKRQQLPKFWRPATPASLQTSAKVAHWDLLNRFTDGSATAETMWEWIETGLMYAHMVHLLTAEEAMQFTPEALEAIAEQLATYPAITKRHRDTSRAGFTAAELLTARAAANVMDSLIELDRHGIALRAAFVGREQANVLMSRFAA
jgi:hypothetical protein